MKLFLKISLLLIFFILVGTTQAQISTPIDGVTIETSTTPRPGESVDVTLESFSFSLANSSIVWIVDGKVFNQGIGLTEITVKAPTLGKTMNITANIKSGEGREIQKTLSIKPTAVEIVWESQGYVPPFFNGKAPFAYQNSVKFIAMPHLSNGTGGELDPRTLVYTWKRDGKYIPEGRGYGKQSITVVGDDLPQEMNISVEVSNRENTQLATNSLILEPNQPSVVFYEEDSLYGVLFNKALTTAVNLRNTEMKILALPFGFSLNSNQNEYTWSINNVDQPNLLKNRSITIRTKGDAGGSSHINLDIRNQDQILQGAEGGFTVNFNKRTNDSTVTF